MMSHVSSSSSSFHKNDNQSCFKSTKNDNETILSVLVLYYIDS